MRGRVLIYFGSEASIDTIPDWQISGNHDGHGYGMISTYFGFDYNGDGYSDFIIGHDENREFTRMEVFDGGEELSYEPRFVWDWDSVIVDDTLLVNSVSPRMDMNGDGKDDFAVSVEGPLRGTDLPIGYRGLLFSDGEIGSFAPDIFLHFGKNVSIGDVNDDGFNDMLVSDHYWHPQRVCLILGSPWMTGQPAFVIDEDDIWEYYRYGIGDEIAPCGDINGDGINDFMFSQTESQGAGSDGSVMIVGGSREWERGVADKERQLPPVNMSMSVSPNPFNSIVSILYSTPPLSDCELTILDISGREIERADVSSGDGVYPWTAPESGLYIVRLSSGNQQTARKLVCVK